jgi:hypothetical protein
LVSLVFLVNLVEIGKRKIEKEVRYQQTSLRLTKETKETKETKKTR